MGKFQVTDPDSGTTLVMDGDSAPSEAEISQAFTVHAQSQPKEGLEKAYEWATTPLVDRMEPKSQEDRQKSLIRSVRQMGLADEVSPPQAQDESAFNNAAFIPRAGSKGEKVERIVAGVSDAAVDTAKFFTSPLGIATLGLGVLPKIAQRAVALAFAAQMASATPELAAQLGDEIGKPEGERDTEKIAKLVTAGVLNTGFTVQGALHGAVPHLAEARAEAKDVFNAPAKPMAGPFYGFNSEMPVKENLPVPPPRPIRDEFVAPEPGPLGIIPEGGTEPVPRRIRVEPPPRQRMRVELPPTQDEQVAEPVAENPSFTPGIKAGEADAVPVKIASELGLTFAPGFSDPSIPGLPKTWDFKLADQPGREMFSFVVPAGSTPEQIAQAKAAKISQLDELEGQKTSESQPPASSVNPSQPEAVPATPPAPAASESPAAQVADQKTEAVTTATTVPAPTVAASNLPLELPKQKPRRVLDAEKDRPPDLIDHIQGQVGKIDPKLIYEADPNWKPDRLARHVFAAGGQPADVAATGLSRDGAYSGDSGQPDQLGAAINNAAAARRTYKLDYYKRQKEAEAQIARDERFKRENKFVRQTTEPIKPDALSRIQKSDSWTLAGEKIRVEEVNRDDAGNVVSVGLRGGEKFGNQFVTAEDGLRMDRGSYRSGKQTGDLFNQPEKPVIETPKLKPGEKSGTLLDVAPDKAKLEAELKSLRDKLPEIRRQIEIGAGKSQDVREGTQWALDDAQKRIAELERILGQRPLTEPPAPVVQQDLLGTLKSEKPLELPKKKEQATLPKKSVNKPVQQDMMAPELPEVKPVEPTGPQKYRIGNSPQLFTLVEKLPQSEIERENGEQALKVKNDKTGEVQTVMETDVTPVKERTADERAANSGKSVQELRDELLKLNPKLRTVIKDFKTKEQLRDAIKRAKAGDEPQANLGEGLPEGEGMSPDEARESVKGEDVAGFDVQIISKDQAAEITGRSEARGYGGFFYKGKVYLVHENMAKGNIEGAKALLREEVGHGLLRTEEGLKQLQSVLDDGKLNLTEAEKELLRKKGYQEHQLLDEFIAKSAMENRPWWKQAVDTVRAWLSKVGLANLSNEEVARLLLKNIRNEIAETKSDFIGTGVYASIEGEPRLKIVKNGNYESTGNYKVILPNGDVKYMYRDVDTMGAWRESDGDYESIGRTLGWNKKDALAELQKRYPGDIAPGEPVPPGTAADTEPIKEERKRAGQFSGVRNWGEVGTVENIRGVQQRLRGGMFDGTQPVSDANTDAAWRIFKLATDPDTRLSFADEVAKLGSPNPDEEIRKIAPALMAAEVEKYAVAMALGGDDTLIRAMVSKSRSWGVISSLDNTRSAAGSAQRGLQEGKGQLFKALEEITKQKLDLLGEKFGSGSVKFNQIFDTLNELNLSESEIMDLFRNGKLPDQPAEPPSPGNPRGRPARPGKTISEVLDEMSPEAKEASSILDKYQRSQTEWLKPEGRLSEIRKIIREAIANGPTAKYQDQAEFTRRLSEQLQEVGRGEEPTDASPEDFFDEGGAAERGVPKAVADELAFEVWKDKAARESAATDKANAKEAGRERRNAEQLLDRWSREQTEWLKPDVKNRTKDAVKEWLQKAIGPELSEEQFRGTLSEELQSFGVPKRIADELAYQTLGRKRTMDDARKGRELAKAAADLSGLADKTAGALLEEFQNKNSGVEWLKPDTAANRIREIVREALKFEKPDPADPQRFEKSLFIDDPAGFTIPLRDRLVAAGVTKPGVAMDLAREVFKVRTNKWADARVQAMKRASQSRNITSLIESIRTAPQELQDNWKWRTETAVRWFESNGLSRDQAEAASKAFWPQFQEAMVKAREREASRLIGKGDMKRLQDLLSAIRLGLTNPDQNWSDTLAMREGWKPLSRDQNAQLAKLETKANDPAMSPTEVAAVHNQMMAINRQSGIQKPKFMQAMAERYVSGMLSSIRTMTIQLGPMVMALRDYPIMALSDPKNALGLASSMYRAYKRNFATEFKYAWQNEAYGFHLGDMDLAHGELNRIWEQAEREYATGTPMQKAAARAKQLFSVGRFVTRTLNTIDQTQMASAREWKLAYYSSIAFKEAGMGTAKISDLVDAMTIARQAAFDRAIDAGATPDAAKVRANNDMVDFVSDFVANKTDGSWASKVVKSAENDVYLMTGRKTHGISEGDEGMLSNAFLVNKGMEAISRLRAEGGFHSILATSLFGFVNIPFRTLRFFSNFHPYGLLRYGIHQYRTSHGLDTYWKQSFANELQARARLREALAGSIVTMIAGAWAVNNSTSDEKAGKNDFGLYITGQGPQNKVMRDAWQKQGWKPYSLNFVVGGRIVAIPVTRVGEALMAPFLIPAGLDDAAWRVKEKEATGNPVNDKLKLYTAALIGEHLSMTGQAGFLQTASQLSKSVQGGEGFIMPLMKMVATTASASVLPLKQLLQSVSDMFVGPLDQSSIGAVVANQFPIIALPLQTRAVNRFGDELYDRSWYGRIAQTGVPIAFQVSKTPDNEDLYTTLVEKGAAPPELRRYIVEEKYGTLSDNQFAQFAKISGDALKTSVLDNLSNLKTEPTAAVKGFLGDAARQADSQAAQKLGLEPVQQATGASKTVSAPSGGSAAPSGLASSLTASKTPGSATLPTLGGRSGRLRNPIRRIPGLRKGGLSLPKTRTLAGARKRLRLGTSRFASVSKPKRLRLA